MSKKTTKVYLLVETDVDVIEGFTKLELGKVAVGMIVKVLAKDADDYDGNASLIFDLAEGQVFIQKPRVITNALEIFEDGEGGIDVFGY